VGMMQWGENPRRTRGGLDPAGNALEHPQEPQAPRACQAPCRLMPPFRLGPPLSHSHPCSSTRVSLPHLMHPLLLLGDCSLHFINGHPGHDDALNTARRRCPPARPPSTLRSPLRLASPPREDICRTPLLRVAVRGQARQGDLAGGSSALSCLLLLTNGTRSSVARARMHTHGHGHCTLSPVLRAPGKPHAPARQTGKQPDSPVLLARSSYRQSGD
jgi:hypothetical protein